MKKVILLTYFPVWAVIVTFFVLSACKKERHDPDDLRCPVEAKDGPDDNVIGKWKLTKVQVVFHEPRIEDYSCQNIVYEFKEDGVLVVSGADEDEQGYNDGEYAFEFTTEPNEILGDIYILKIQSTNIACQIKDNQMILDNSPLDGPKLHLVRVE